MSKEVLLAVNSLTDVPECRKRSNNTATAIFVHMVHTVDHQVRQQRSESRDAFTQAPRAD